MEDKKIQRSCSLDRAMVVFTVVQAAYVIQWPYDYSVYMHDRLNQRDIGLVVAMQQISSLVAYMFPCPWGSRRVLIIACQIMGFSSCLLKLNHIFSPAAIIQGIAIGTTAAVLDLKHAAKQVSFYQPTVSMMSWALASVVVDTLHLSPEAVYFVACYGFLCGAVVSYLLLDDDNFIQHQSISRKVERLTQSILAHLEHWNLSLIFISRTCIEASSAVALAVYPMLARRPCSSITPSVGMLLVLRTALYVGGLVFTRTLAGSRGCWRFIQLLGCITTLTGVVTLGSAKGDNEACFGNLLLALGASQCGVGLPGSSYAITGNLVASGVIALPVQGGRRHFLIAVTRTGNLLYVALCCLILLITMDYCSRPKRCAAMRNCNQLRVNYS
ncbi:uncharacterized protein LOC135392772 [Ornithodoros turicata]|uniref:uncharacterized protein LOC135392772 n=1 Tax=Ornithodoros turicata TaxID=34597 RepID=UPI00313A24E8